MTEENVAADEAQQSGVKDLDDLLTTANNMRDRVLNCMTVADISQAMQEPITSMLKEFCKEVDADSEQRPTFHDIFTLLSMTNQLLSTQLAEVASLLRAQVNFGAYSLAMQTADTAFAGGAAANRIGPEDVSEEDAAILDKAIAEGDEQTVLEVLRRRFPDQPMDGVNIVGSRAFAYVDPTGPAQE